MRQQVKQKKDKETDEEHSSWSILSQRTVFGQASLAPQASAERRQPTRMLLESHWIQQE
jgi:hypothetical protein